MSNEIANTEESILNVKVTRQIKQVLYIGQQTNKLSFNYLLWEKSMSFNYWLWEKSMSFNYWLWEKSMSFNYWSWVK